MKVPFIIFVYAELVYIATLSIHVSLGQKNLPAKHYGASFEIECDTARTVDVYSWTLNGTSITAITVGIDSTTISLRFLLVESMTLALEGQYECFAPDNQLLDTINVFVIGRALYPRDDCLLQSIGACVNNVTYSQGESIFLNASIHFDNIGSMNLVADVISTAWTIIFSNRTRKELSCRRNNTCSHSLPGLSIITTMSGDRLNDTAIIEAGSADYNFNITHTFHTDGLNAQIEDKIFILHYIPTEVTSSSSPIASNTLMPTATVTSTETTSTVMTTSEAMVTESTTAVMTTPTNTMGSTSGDDGNGGNSIAIVLGVVLGIIGVGVIIAIIVVLVCYKNNRKKGGIKLKPPPVGLHFRKTSSSPEDGAANTTTSERPLINGSQQPGAFTPMSFDGKPLVDGSVTNGTVDHRDDVSEGEEPNLSDTDASVDV